MTIAKISLHFILKLFSLLRYLNFSPDFFGYVGKQFDKKAKFKTFMTSQTGTRTIAINIYNILSDMSKSKGSQTMEFGQLIEYNVRSIFL